MTRTDAAPPRGSLTADSDSILKAARALGRATPVTSANQSAAGVAG